MTQARPPGRRCVRGRGLLLGASVFLSYGLTGRALPLAVTVTTRRLAPLLVAAFAAAGFWWLDGYRQVVIRYYQPGEYGPGPPVQLLGVG